MKNKILALALSGLALLFVVLAGWSAVAFIIAGTWLSVSIGVAVILMLVFGVWAVVRELRFGAQTQQLAEILETEGGLPEDNLPRIKGRIVRDAADAQFETFRAETEADPENWRNWFRLSLAYDASGDRPRARQTMRDAITKYRNTHSN